MKRLAILMASVVGYSYNHGYGGYGAIYGGRNVRPVHVPVHRNSHRSYYRPLYGGHGGVYYGHGYGH